MGRVQKVNLAILNGVVMIQPHFGSYFANVEYRCKRKDVDRC